MREPSRLFGACGVKASALIRRIYKLHVASAGNGVTVYAVDAMLALLINHKASQISYGFRVVDVAAMYEFVIGRARFASTI